MDLQKEREAFQNFCEQNFDFERHEQTYFDEQTQCYENDLGECTESINMAWSTWQAAKAQAVPEWIETAIQPPEEGQTVIISGIYGVGIAEFSYMYKNEFVMYDMGASNPILSKDQVKFWMPLPDAPQEPAND